MTTPTAEDHRAALAAEWGKYVAKNPIDIGGARAFNPGDPVPASTVERDGSPINRDDVVGANTKTAAAVTEKG